MQNKIKVLIETSQRAAVLYADSVFAADYVAANAMQCGAVRVWVDGKLMGGPINEIEVEAE